VNGVQFSRDSLPAGQCLKEAMSKIILDTALEACLNGLNEQLEICDADGQMLGRYLPKTVHRRLLCVAAEAACPHEQRRGQAIHLQLIGQLGPVPQLPAGL
jgi:hypothetical protein